MITTTIKGAGGTWGQSTGPVQFSAAVGFCKAWLIITCTTQAFGNFSASEFILSVRGLQKRTAADYLVSLL